MIERKIVSGLLPRWLSRIGQQDFPPIKSVEINQRIPRICDELGDGEQTAGGERERPGKSCKR